MDDFWVSLFLETPISSQQEIEPWILDVSLSILAGQ